jgi:hypothetical protein
MANGNAFAFMRLMGLEPDDCGTLAAEDLPSYAARALELMNRPALRQLELRPGTCRQSMKTVAEGNVVSIVRGPKIFEGGLSDEQVLRYASTFHSLATQAHQGGFAVSWG